MRKIDSLDVATVNFIVSPLIYLVILLPLVNFFNINVKLISIVMVIHTILFWSLCIYYEKRVV